MTNLTPGNSHTNYPEFKEDLDRLVFAMKAAGIGVWELDINTNEIIWDDKCSELFGLDRDNRLPYARVIQYIHNSDLEAVNTAFQEALKGEDNGKFDMRCRTIGPRNSEPRWVYLNGRAYFDDNGKVTRFGGIAQDITAYSQALYNSEEALLQSESRFRTVIASAPAGIGVFVGRDLIIDMPNQVFIDIVGKGQNIAGRPLREVMPELENQPFLQILDNIFTTGETFRSYDTPVNIVQNGTLTTSYYNVTFSPLFDSEGKVYAILDISIDVTENAKSRKELEEAQNTLQDAIELAKLATWVIDAKSGKVQYSERLKSWLGINETARMIEKGIQSLPAHEREHVKNALQWAMDPGSNGVFDLEYGIINQETGRERIIHSQGRTFFDDRGKPVKVVGVAQDVTQQRNARLALEHEVQQRTEELDAANEELQATNEELQSINDELARLNEQLEKSNENLQQFAHVASHDLKEPVRKIKTFLSLIEADPETVLSPKTRQLLERVYIASDRIFSMINGVLAYSTINATGQSISKLNIRKILDQVVHDLELSISQKKAIIEYDHFPEIEGAEILIYQLFLNLISNSLKFSKADVPPVITISGEPVTQNNKALIKLIIADNGAGFPSHQADRIFNMFARLHSKDKYEGTGLGLALCKKIIERHEGKIEASGTTGEGAVFTILLPVHQSQDVI